MLNSTSASLSIMVYQRCHPTDIAVTALQRPSTLWRPAISQPIGGTEVGCKGGGLRSSPGAMFVGYRSQANCVSNPLIATGGPLGGRWMSIGGHFGLHDASFHVWETDSAAIKSVLQGHLS